MHSVETEIGIQASAERVRKLLTEFASYPRWNPFIRSIEGELSAQVESFSGPRTNPPSHPSLPDRQGLRSASTTAWQGKRNGDVVRSSPSAPARQDLLAALAPFAAPDTPTGVRLFAIDLAVYAVGMSVALFADAFLARLLGAVVVGLKMGSIYTLAHDAVHNSLTSSRRINRLLGSLGYLLSFHNYRIRQYDHLVLGHHPSLNGPQPDVYRPLSWQAYRSAPVWRQAWERFARSPNPLVFAPYGICTRWLLAEVWPPRAMATPARRQAWGYFVLLTGYLGFIVAWLVHRNVGNVPGLVADLGLVLGLPFFIFQTLQAAILYFQHTHPEVPWFSAQDPGFSRFGPESLTVHVLVPPWLNTLTHDICEHPAHHVMPAIPCYRLRSAQAKLDALTGGKGLKLRLSPRAMAAIMRSCKVYDYERHTWLDFGGRPTTGQLVDAPAAARAA